MKIFDIKEIYALNLVSTSRYISMSAFCILGDRNVN